ncbi:hypothetical protein KYG33_12730 [Chryseobacterium sp. D764]|jgi:hypothetical protein|uniref:hypothetical protein n=1 Tax=unclassified Chryseobacterium TaxID=2593645 RepID=UPI0009866C8F|nr:MULTISPECIES: hypothetical protein [unclassified Chryseobacterium]QXU47673.1 hypothetical protein KYG33_12730 [Chryseobacterium sp. D764]CAD0221902.1 conserved protein of unknown function [Chryseobacterium sp. JV274]
MKKDQLQDKYNEVFRDIKEEKMDWSFEDFLQTAEGAEPEQNATPVIPLQEKKKPSFPKWFWMAASVMLVLSIGFFLNNNNKNAQDKEKLVKDEILKQKSGFIEENSDHQEQVAINHTDSISGVKKDSVFQDNQVAEKDVMDEILPKRGRLKKETRPRYVSNSSNSKSLNDSATAYNDSYVIVNGKRISSEKEAIDVAKYSFMKLGTEFKKTVASSQKNENLDSEY